MFDTICTLPLDSELFAQAIHPSDPLLAVGLSSGHVATLKLPSVESRADDDEDVEDEGPARKRRRGSDGTGVVDTAWRTRRHKGSCRTLSYSLDGRSLYSAGTDGILKAADAESGRVTGKVAIPVNPSSVRKGDEVDAPTVLHALSPQTLLVATDSGALHLYDLRDPAPSISDAPVEERLKKAAFTNYKPAQTHYPHQDYVSSLTPLPPSSTSTSGYSKQWLTTGGTTLALTDLRRGVLVKSEDQEELLLSSIYVSGLAAKKASGSTGEKALVGGSDGVITLWEKGRWDDQDERITVSKEKETLDCMAVVPNGLGGPGKKVAIGLGDGKVRFVRLGQNRVVGEVMHDEVEGVVELGFDAGGRMISGGGQTIKVWQEHVEDEEDEDQDDSVVEANGINSKPPGSDNEVDSEQEDDSSDEEVEKTRKRRKKRKRGKGPAAPSSFSFAGLD
jgi:WD repeat-containing protein 55